MIGFYAVGFVFYFFHIPEKWFPGRFDYWFHSHQIWHICVVAAIVVWFITSLETSSLLINRGCGAFVHDGIMSRLGGDFNSEIVGEDSASRKHSSITAEEQEELSHFNSNSSIIDGMLLGHNGQSSGIDNPVSLFASEVNIHLHDAIDSLMQPASLRGSRKGGNI
jgi:hypothetical protein